MFFLVSVLSLYPAVYSGGIRTPILYLKCEELNASSLGFVDGLVVLLICPKAPEHRLPWGMGRKESAMGVPSEASEPHFPRVASLSPSSVFRMSLLGMLFGFGAGLLLVGAYGLIILHRAWVGALATGRGPSS